MSEIFISYAREDASRIEPLAKCLLACGWSVFWDRQIPAGRQWSDVIGAALERADRVIVAWSHASLRSDFVRDEAAAGQARRILMPILLDPVMPPLGFRQIQAADLSQWNGDPEAGAFQQLLRDLCPPVASPPGASLIASAKSISPVKPHDSRGLTASFGGRQMWSRLAVGGAIAVAIAAIAIPRIGANTVVVPSGVPTASTYPVPGGPKAQQGTDDDERRQVLEVLGAYYHDLNSNSIQASRYFAPNVVRYIGMQKTSAEEIDRYFQREFPVLYQSYRAEMDEDSLVRERARVFTYLQTARFYELKKHRSREVVARVNVELDGNGKIVVFDETATTSRAL